MQQYQTWSVCSCCQQSHEPINKSFKRPVPQHVVKLIIWFIFVGSYINNYRSYTEDYFLHALSLCCCFVVVFLFFVVFFVNARVVFFLVSELLWWS